MSWMSSLCRLRRVKLTFPPTRCKNRAIRKRLPKPRHFAHKVLFWPEFQNLQNQQVASFFITRSVSFEVALMSGRRAESLGFLNKKRARGTAFFIPRSVSKECLGQGNNTAKVSPSLTRRVVIILKCATSKLAIRLVKDCLPRDWKSTYR